MPSRISVNALVVTIVVIEFVSGFTQGFYEPLIPQFGVALGVDASTLTLFNIVPTAIAALVVPLLTRLGDIYGYRRLLRIVIGVVVLATIVIWLGVQTGSWGLVLAGRLLNGPIAVWLPLHIALVHAKTSGHSATRAVAAIIATLTIGTVVGTALSGFIFEALGGLAQAVLVVPPLQLIALALVVFVMPEFVSGAQKYLDLPGFALLAATMLTAIIGVVLAAAGGTDRAVGLGSLAVSVLFGWLWYRHENRTEHPAIDVKLLFSPRLGPLYLAAISFGAVFYGWLSPLATYLAADPDANGFGYGLAPRGISVAQTLILLVTVIGALLIPVLLRRVGTKSSLVAGFIVAILGFAQWAFLPPTYLRLGALVLLAGLGFGVISAVIPAAIPLRAPQGTHGIATGLFNSSQTLGGALGGSVLGAALRIGSGPSGEITGSGYSAVWYISIALLLLGLAAVALLLHSDRRINDGARAEVLLPVETDDVTAGEAGR